MNTSNFVLGCNECFFPDDAKNNCAICGKSGEFKKLIPLLYCDECATIKSNKCCGCDSHDPSVKLMICTDCYEGECYYCHRKI